MKTDGYGSSYTNTLIPLQRLHSLACSYRGSRRPLFPAKAGRGSPSARRSSLLHQAWAYAKDQASSPPDGLLKDNPPPSAQTKYKGYRERSEPAPGVAGMGLMDFEAQGRQGAEAVLGCTPRTPDDVATKKGANPNSGKSDERTRTKKVFHKTRK